MIVGKDEEVIISSRQGIRRKGLRRGCRRVFWGCFTERGREGSEDVEERNEEGEVWKN
jgi:hypothetical protein